MPRPHPLTATMTALLLAVTLTAASHPGPEALSSGSWGSSLAKRDPDPGFWRAQPGELPAGARPYSFGMASLAAMTRIRVAPGHDPGPLAAGAMVVRGDRVVFRSSAITAFHSSEARAATLLLATDIAQSTAPDIRLGAAWRTDAVARRRLPRSF